MKVYNSQRLDSDYIYEEELTELENFCREELQNAHVPIISFSKSLHVKLDNEEDRVKFAVYCGLDVGEEK